MQQIRLRTEKPDSSFILSANVRQNLGRVTRLIVTTYSLRRVHDPGRRNNDKYVAIVSEAGTRVCVYASCHSCCQFSGSFVSIQAAARWESQVQVSCPNRGCQVRPILMADPGVHNTTATCQAIKGSSALNEYIA